MKIIYKDFDAVYSIVCPFCKFKQTGVVRIYDQSDPNGPVSSETLALRGTNRKHEYFLAIKCVMDKLNAQRHCGRLITGDQLEEVTRSAVKSPSDFRS